MSEQIEKDIQTLARVLYTVIVSSSNGELRNTQNSILGDVPATEQLLEIIQKRSK